jgi:hypothetical protein
VLSRASIAVPFLRTVSTAARLVRTTQRLAFMYCSVAHACAASLDLVHVCEHRASQCLALHRVEADISVAGVHVELQRRRQGDGARRHAG